MLAAAFTGGAFIFPTFHIYGPAIVCGAFAIVCVLYWLWTDTALIPEAPTGDVGLGLTLPRYASGSDAPGWWAVWITMLGDATAFACLVFGFFFYWTASDNFPPAGAAMRTTRQRCVRGAAGPVLGGDAGGPSRAPAGPQSQWGAS